MPADSDRSSPGINNEASSRRWISPSIKVGNLVHLLAYPIPPDPRLVFRHEVRSVTAPDQSGRAKSMSNRWPGEEIDGELPEYEKGVAWKVKAVPAPQVPGAYPNNEEKLYTVQAAGQEEKRVPGSQMLPVKFLKGDEVTIRAGGGSGGTWVHKVTAVRMMRTACSEKGWEVVVEYGLEHVRDDGIIRPDTQRANMLGMKEKGDEWRAVE